MNAQNAGFPGAATVFRVERASTVDLIAIELRKAIFSGGLPVGRSLGEVEIASQLGVSRGSLREASQRLVQDGLLAAIPGRGLVVPTIAGEEIADVYEARLAVESQAARRVARAKDPGALARISAAFRELALASEGDDARLIGDADLEFHQTLVDEAGSKRLSRYMAALAVQTRLASFSASDGYSVRRSVSPTYHRLLDALASGDEHGAVAALEQQFEDAVARLQGREREVETVETPTGAVPLEFQPLEGPETG